MLSDFFLHGLRYEEIARKHGLAVGSVGVYLKRGLEAHPPDMGAHGRIDVRSEPGFAMKLMNDYE